MGKVGTFLALPFLFLDVNLSQTGALKYELRKICTGWLERITLSLSLSLCLEILWIFWQAKLAASETDCSIVGLDLSLRLDFSSTQFGQCGLGRVGAGVRAGVRTDVRARVGAASLLEIDQVPKPRNVLG